MRAALPSSRNLADFSTVKNVLILSSSAGMGHIRAGRALEAAFLRNNDCNVTHRDILDFMTPLYRMVYADSYEWMVTHTPCLWKIIYHATDRESSDYLQSVNRHFAQAFYDWTRNKNFDAVICTHFLPPEFLVDLRASGGLNALTAVVVTDFDFHRVWAHHGIDRYFAPSPEIAGRIPALTGMPPDAVETTGIPIMPQFAETVDKEAVRKKIQIDERVPTALFLSSGIAHGGMVDAIQAAMRCTDRPIQIFAVAGKNQELKSRIDALPRPNHVKLITFPFIDYVHELMAVADVLFGKSGGLSTSEALASGLPMIVTHAIPGQEEANMRYVVKIGAGRYAPTLEEQSHVLRSLLSHPALLEKMKTAAQNAGRPRAALDIARSVLAKI